MNWIERIHSYYTNVTPEEFFEWEFQKYIPRYTKLSKFRRVSNELITVALMPTETYVTKEQNSLFLKNNCSCAFRRVAGNMSSQVEVRNKYQQFQKNAQSQVLKFAETLKNQGYFFLTEHERKLCKYVSENSSGIEIENYGPVKDVMQKLSGKLDQLFQQSKQKHYRAYELEVMKKYFDYLSALGESSVPLDATKMDYLLKMGGVDRISSYSISPQDLYIAISDEGKEMRLKMDWYEHFKWLKSP